MTEDLEKKVKEIVAKELDVEEIKVTATSSFVDDLGADSLDQVELIMALEDAFGCEIPDDVAEKIVTVGDAIKFIQEHKK